MKLGGLYVLVFNSLVWQYCILLICYIRFRSITF